MEKYADHIARVFVKEGSAGFLSPGHEEIELALLKLYDYLGEKKHLELARFFINESDIFKNTIVDFVSKIRNKEITKNIDSLLDHVYILRNIDEAISKSL